MVPLADAIGASGFDTLIPDFGIEPHPDGFHQRHAAQVDQMWSRLKHPEGVVVAHSGAGILSGIINSAGVAAHVMLDAIFPDRPGSRFDYFDDAGAASEWQALADHHSGRLPAERIARLGRLIQDHEMRSTFESEVRDVPLELYTERAPIRPDWSAGIPGLYVHWSQPYRYDAARALRAGFHVVHRPATHLELINDPVRVASSAIDFVRGLRGG